MIKINKRKCREYANPDCKLRPSSGILHAKAIDYIITTDIKIIASHRILILFIYSREKACKGDCKPLWTMFHTKDDFLTLEQRKPDDSTRWRTASFDRLDDYYSNKQYAFYSAQDEKRVQRYFKTDTDGFQTLSSAQNAILSRRCRERRIAKETVIVSRMAGIQALPRGLKSWIKSIMPAYFFYDYKRGAKQVAGICSACGHEVTIPGIKQGGQAVCPHCRHELTAKPRSRRGSNMYDRETFEVIQNMDDGRLVIRIIKAYFSYKTDIPDVDIYENIRQFLWQDADGEFCTEHYYYCYNSGILTPWKKGIRPEYIMYQQQFEAGTCGRLYTPNLPETLSGTSWEYCTIADFYNHFHENMQALPFLREHLEHPKLELLCKVGFYNIASDLVYKNTANCLDETQNRTHRILRVAAEDVDFLRNMDIDLSALAIFQQYAGIKGRQRLLIWQLENDVKYNILPILKYITVHKLIRYTEKQFQQLCSRKGQHGSIRYQKLQDVITEFRDYLQICESLNYDMKSSFVLYPSDLQQAHDRIQKLFKIRENELLLQNFKTVIQDARKHMAFESDGMKIVFPSTPRDLETEGNALHHCVSRYADSVAKKECIILFLRKCSNAFKPFYTIEVRGQQIVQVRGMKNCQPTEEVKKFLDEFKRKVLQASAGGAA